VRLEGEFMFLTTKVLEIAREAEAERLAKRPRGRPRKQPVIRERDGSGWVGFCSGLHPAPAG
jgi:hypothetical protein